jgi:hypothetical protein
MGLKEIPEFGWFDQHAGSAVRCKPLRTTTTCPHAGSRVIRRGFLILSRFWIAVTLSLLASTLHPAAGYSQPASNALFRSPPKTQPDGDRSATCKIVYVGIVGGTETSNNRRSGVVQIRDILREPAYPNVCAKSVSPYAWRSGFRWILMHFPSHSGRLTSIELEGAPKVILVGHSLGGWGVLSVARNLNRKGISVELCVQIDSVGITDHTVPRNVKAAAIFHANDALFLLTTKTIKLEDPGQSKLVESVLVNGAGHWSVTRDPRIYDLVLCTVQSLDASSGQRSDCPSQPEPKRAVSSTERPLAVQ